MKWKPVVILAAGLLLGGCSYDKQFVYKPNAAIAVRPEIPLSVAVFPFEDGTPEWKQKNFMIPIGITVFHMRQNYAKMPYMYTDKEPFISPERWARDFARDLAASGAFGSVQYAEGGKDPGGELIIKGKVLEALMGTRWVGVEIIPFYLSAYYRYSATFQMIRRSDGKVLWERTIRRTHKNLSSTPTDVTPMLWRSMFGEAVADLVKMLQERRSDWSDLKVSAPPSSAPANESVEDILKKLGSQ